MDLMSIRRGLMSMAGGLPGYVKHYSFTPSEGVRTITHTFSNGLRYALIASTCPTSGLSDDTVMCGSVIISNNNVYSYSSRLTIIKTNDATSYYSSSNANNTWTYDNGVLTLSCTAGWVFGAGIKYDVFYVE